MRIVATQLSGVICPDVMRALLLVWFLIGCGSSSTTTKSTTADPEAVFGALEIGADYASYRKLTDKPFLSLDHGNRWVDVYVNEIGFPVYETSEAIPVGTIIVKTSVIDENGAPGTVAGPIYVMQKREKGYAPDDDDWWYAIHWASPPADEKFGPLYWRGKSARVDYCANCHSSYDRGIGGLIPSSILKR